ncbi:MAG: hypothetical protein PHX04_04130 [Bacilli bacterium]|nr:hypothetical protein [Bacilli bacterium]
MLKEVDSVALRSAVFDLEDAYKPFFDKRAEYPNYKCKGYKESYRTSNMVSVYKDKEYNSIELDLDEKTIKLPKLKKINIRGYRNLKGINGRIINATIKTC